MTIPLGAGALEAQSTAPAVSGGGGATFQTFRFSDADAVGIESITLLTTPFAAGVRLGSAVRIEASTTFAQGSLSRPGGEKTSVSGLTDTRIQLLTEVVPNRLTVSGLVSLPTGAAEFTVEEVGLAGAVAADLLPFEISSWGSGGGVGGGVAFFQPAGSMGIGGSVGYTIPGEFNPVQDAEFRYRPGAALAIQGIVDYTLENRSRLALQFNWNRFSDDEVQGVNLFRSGDRLEMRGSWAFTAGAQGSGVAWAGYLHRSEGAFLDDLRSRPSQGLYFAGAGLRHSWGGMVVAPTAELRVQRRDDGTDQGTLAGAGLRVEIPAGDVLVIPRIQLRGGSVLIRDGVDSGVVGVEAGLALRFGGGGR
ncbi:MAG: hypothetical protein EA422_15155 [Gemmatimonadales bacterium]|nr:MAG: hypothetical protein EA422_15155 [Gemmatimonadales bacterium]